MMQDAVEHRSCQRRIVGEGLVLLSERQVRDQAATRLPRLLLALFELRDQTTRHGIHNRAVKRRGGFSTSQAGGCHLLVHWSGGGCGDGALPRE